MSKELENTLLKARASVSWIYTNLLGSKARFELLNPTERKRSEEEYVAWGLYLLPIEQAIEDLEKYLTPPTVDEVCMAIQNELPHGNVEYIEGNKEFMFVNRGEKSNVTSVYGDRYYITGFYKSSTITLIGRFYEGLEK